MVDSSYHPGLEGITVAKTRLSQIDGAAGELTIGGFPVAELARQATHAEACFLLWNDRLPTQSELEQLQADLGSRREIPAPIEQTLRRAAAENVPAMDALRMGASAISLEVPDGDSAEQARRLVSTIPTIIATYWRFQQGEGPPTPDPTNSPTADFLAMLTGESPDAAAVRGLNTYLTTVADHGVNASTFTARVITSTESDLVSAVTGAIGALKGPLHGGAPGPVLEMITDIYEQGDAEGYLTDRLDAGKRIMGFGHRVYEVRDPRVSVLSDAAESFYDEAGEQEFFDVAQEIEETALTILRERYPAHSLETNVEFYTALLLHGLDIPREIFTAVFAMGRGAGWTAHCLEQRADNRLIRPDSTYIGETDRSWVPISQR